jgi:hypothetical protein
VCWHRHATRPSCLCVCVSPCALQAFLSILCAMKWGTFLFFAGWVLIMTIFVILCVPETKVSLF